MSDVLLPLRPRDSMPAELSVIGRTGMSPATVYRLIKAGEFPAPLKRGATSLWPASKVDAWVEKLKENAA